ncbi:hypothetical protein, partial [Chitinimonas sp.]|uniref:hypothetical protein n=1 Tax=Chitinimonas sp. TaxID=1934313 RepID=UPI0035AE8771
MSARTLIFSLAILATLHAFSHAAETSKAVIVAPSFAAVTGVPPDALISSANIPLNDLSGPTSLAITGGEYFLNGRGPFTRKLTVVRGDKIRLRVKAPSSYAATSSCTLFLGPRS